MTVHGFQLFIYINNKFHVFHLLKIGPLKDYFQKLYCEKS